MGRPFTASLSTREEAALRPGLSRRKGGDWSEGTVTDTALGQTRQDLLASGTEPGRSPWWGEKGGCVGVCNISLPPPEPFPRRRHLPKSSPCLTSRNADHNPPWGRGSSTPMSQAGVLRPGAQKPPALSTHSCLTPESQAGPPCRSWARLQAGEMRRTQQAPLPLAQDAHKRRKRSALGLAVHGRLPLPRPRPCLGCPGRSADRWPRHAWAIPR